MAEVEEAAADAGAGCPAAVAIHGAVETATRGVVVIRVAAAARAAAARHHLVNPAAAAAAAPSAAGATSAADPHSCRPEVRIWARAPDNGRAEASALREATGPRRCLPIVPKLGPGRVPAIAHRRCLRHALTWVGDPASPAGRAFLRSRLSVPVQRLVRGWQIVSANAPQRYQVWVTGGLG